MKKNSVIRAFFLGKKQTLPTPPWKMTDAFKMIFLTSGILYLVMYGSLHFSNWYWGEEAVALWMVPRLTGIIIAGMIFQIVLEMVLLYYYTHHKYGVKMKDFGFKNTPIRSTLVLGILLFAFVTIAQNTFVPWLEGIGIPHEGEDLAFKMLIENEIIPMWFLFVFVGIIAPLTEEIIFRGFILPAVMKDFGYVWGVVIASAMFAFAHLAFNPITLLILFLMGALLSVLYIRTQSLWPGVIFHGINNNLALYFLISSIHSGAAVTS